MNIKRVLGVNPCRQVSAKMADNILFKGIVEVKKKRAQRLESLWKN